MQREVHIPNGRSCLATPHERLVWAQKVFAQPAGYAPDFFLIGERPRDEAAEEYDLATRRWRLEVDKKPDGHTVPNCLVPLERALDAISGISENWTEEAVARMPEWDEIRALATAALASLGEDASPPDGPVDPTTYIAVTPKLSDRIRDVVRTLSKLIRKPG